MNLHPQNDGERDAVSQTGSDRAGGRVRRAADRVSRRLQRLEERAGAALDETEQQTLSAARVISQWVSDNPRIAIGALIGTGLLVGVIGSLRIGRATLFGLGGIAIPFVQRIARPDASPHVASA
jgi:ElaB/YqjD/DUF883 family membrane-anchored ribosome-binding protein